MGSIYSKFFSTNYKVIMFGLNASGKTSIINYLKNKTGDYTYDRNFESNIRFFPYLDPVLNYKGLSVIEIDIGDWPGVKHVREEELRNKLNQAFKDTKGIIFVIDSYYIDGLEDHFFFDDFDYILSHEDLKHLPILFLANKQDLDKALSKEEVITKIGFEKLKEKRWFSVGTSVENGEGIEKGFDWMISIIKQLNG